MNYYLPFIFSCIQFSFQNYIFTPTNASNLFNYDCLDGPLDVCRLLNVTYNNTQEILTFSSGAPEKVTWIQIARSSIAFLMSDFCRSFPGTEIFKLRSVSLKKIDKEALILCKNLSNFDVIGNQLRYLDEDTFIMNSKLEYIFLSTNNLRCVHVNLFQGLTILKELYLSYNKLRYLNPLTFKDLKDLRLLSLHSNQLLEFEVRQVVGHMPKLETIHLKYNEFKCSELEEILKVLSEKPVKYDKTLTKVDCEPDEEYELRNTCIINSGFKYFPNGENSSERKDVYGNGLLLVISFAILTFF